MIQIFDTSFALLHENLVRHLQLSMNFSIFVETFSHGNYKNISRSTFGGVH